MPSGLLAFQVYPALTGSVTGNASATRPGALVRFTAIGQGGSGSYQFEWAFGDTGRAIGASATHRYSGAGTYETVVWINDTLESSVMKTWNVTVSQLPGAVSVAQSLRSFSPRVLLARGRDCRYGFRTGCILGLSEEAVGPPAYLPLDP